MSITDFLNRFTSEYNLSLITEKQALYIENNISKGGRVSNFIVDKKDIRYFKHVLFKILFKDDKSIQINNIKDLMYYIDIIAEWIQLRLNTRFLFFNKDWDYFNKRYVKVCFGIKNFEEMNKQNKIDTNIRNLFFGDCREHEILLHILTKIFINHLNLNDKYIIRRLDAKGITIADKEKIQNKSQYTQDSKWRDGDNIVGGLGRYYDQWIGHWEHTHSVLHDLSSDKLYSIDAIRYNTKWNSLTFPTHNIELQIVNLYSGDCIPFVNYIDLVDKNIRTYIETPAPFSKRDTKIITSYNKSLLFSNKFKLSISKFGDTKKEETYKKYRIISIGDLLVDNIQGNRFSRIYSHFFDSSLKLFDKTINLLCVNTTNSSSTSKSSSTSMSLSASKSPSALKSPSASKSPKS